MTKKLNVSSHRSKFWRTADGEKILYKDITNAHLKNIIKDGYRNEGIREEAHKRGIEVPTRLVESMETGDILMWVESFASTALSGNKFASAMIQLWNDGSPEPAFWINFEAFLQAQKKRKEEKSV